MADDIKSALTEALYGEADDNDDRTLKPYHPNGDEERSEAYGKGSEGLERKHNGRLDTSNVSAKELSDRYEAKDPNKENVLNAPDGDAEIHTNTGNENSDNPSEGSNEENGDKPQGGGDASGEGAAKDGDGNEKRSLLNDLGEAKEELGEMAQDIMNMPKQCIEDFKHKLNAKKEEREKWGKVLEKAQKDDNWQKNKIPKWSTKLLVKTGGDLRDKAALKDFEKQDKEIKKLAFKRRMALKAHGSVKKAEDTMEEIKDIREKMTENAPVLRQALPKAVLNKHPLGRCLTKLQLDRFVDHENGLFNKIFDPENSACTKSCSMKMIVLTVIGSGALGTILTLIFTF